MVVIFGNSLVVANALFRVVDSGVVFDATEDHCCFFKSSDRRVDAFR